MKREKISHALGSIDPAYVEEAALHKPRSPVWIRWTAAAACVCLIALAAAALPGLTRPVDPPVTDPGTAESPTPPQTQYDPLLDPGVIWGTDLSSAGTTELELPELSEGVSISWTLSDTLSDADESDLIAVVVCVTAAEDETLGDSVLTYIDAAAYSDLYTAFNEKEWEMTGIYHDRVDFLMEADSISRQEAQARAFSDAEYLLAREDCTEAKAAAVSYYLDGLYAAHGEALDHLVEQGFAPAFDATDETYHPYLNIYSALGVVVGTKEQICSLDPGENRYTLYLASDRAAEFEYLSYNPYIGKAVDLSDGSKLTDDLLAAYGENGGAAIPVTVKIAYWGPVYTSREADRIVLEDMGFSSKEDLYCNGTEEDEDYFIEQRSRVFYHRDYNTEVAFRLTEDGELIGCDEFEYYYNCCFSAMLTYERALELAGSSDVAYLDLPDGEGKPGVSPDPGIYIE